MSGMGPPRTPIEDRFWPKVEESPDGCWLWTGQRNRAGYGSIRGPGRDAALLMAHRVAYELVVGKIRDGLTIDHLCGNQSCVNPAHLEPVTIAENIRRAARKRSICLHGHPLDGWQRSRPGKPRTRYCRTCKYARNRHRRARSARS
jgi:hypothetical protein